LSLFFGTLLVRNPASIDYSAIPMKKEFRAIAEISSQKMGRQLKQGQLEKIHPSRNFLVKIMIDRGMMMSAILIKMNWILIETPIKRPFITCDNILNVYNSKSLGIFKHGLGMHGATIYIPISSTLTLVMINDKSFIDGTVIDLEKESKIGLHIKSSGELNKNLITQTKRYFLSNVNNIEYLVNLNCVLKNDIRLNKKFF
jgi:hypothetical protein